MRKTTIKITLFLILSIISTTIFSQTAVCDGMLPFEEQNGLLTIEMESGIINHPNWKVDNSVPGYTGSGYIYWDGPQSFNNLSNAPIIYNIKINTPGTYRFAWHMKINMGTSNGEHNDSWLKIDADDYYGIKSGHRVIPRPACETDANNDCPEGKSEKGFFKIFGNTQEWRFVANTNDGDSHRVFVTFDNPGEYKITLDARSSYCLLDRMVLRLNGISDSVAFDLSNTESSCYDGALSVNSEKIEKIEIYPNPTHGNIKVRNIPANSNLIISNVYGAVILEINNVQSLQTIDVSELKSGVYFITNRDGKKFFSKKIIKI